MSLQEASLNVLINSSPSILQYLGLSQAEIHSVVPLREAYRIHFRNTEATVLLIPSSKTDVNTQSVIIEQLLEAKFPVLRPLIHYQASDILNTPFWVTAGAQGNILADLPSHVDKDPYLLSLMSILAQLHAKGTSTQSEHYAKEIARWSRIYKLNETRIEAHIEDLIYWLPMNIPVQLSPLDTTTLSCDYSADNIVCHPSQPAIVALTGIDEAGVSTAFQDLAVALLAYFIPAQSQLGGVKGMERQFKMPAFTALLEHYLKTTNAQGQIDLRFNVILQLLKIAALNQAEYKGSLKGTEEQKAEGLIKQRLAQEAGLIGWNLILEIGNGDPYNIREQVQNDSFRWAGQEVTQRCQSYYYRVKDFMKKELFPIEKKLYYTVFERAGEAHWQGLPELEALQRKAKALGLWNLFIGDPVYGVGLTNVEYTHISELMGLCYFAHELFNCFAPETGNIKLLIGYGTAEQKEKYLKPLLEGDCKTYFAMSEKDVPSSDPTNFKTTITKVEGGYLVNGRKWFVSGIGDERCRFGIVMGKTDPKAKPLLQQSMFLVDMPQPGVKILRNMSVMGYDDAPHGYFEVEYKDCFVPEKNILGKEGAAFAMAQARLAGGRLQHSVRQIGQAQRCMHLMLDRSEQRKMFGEYLKDNQAFQNRLGQMEIQLQTCRFLALNAATLLDKLGGRHFQTLKAVSETKAYVPKTAQKIIDNCIQAYGAEGVSYDQMLALSWQLCRAIRFMDGPDEVHQRQVARFTQGNHMFNDFKSAEGYGISQTGFGLL